MSKIHTLGLSVFSAHKPSWGGGREKKPHFNINGWQAGSTWRSLSLFFCSPPWKYPAEALGRVLPGSHYVNVNFLPVTEETLPHTTALVPLPRPPRHGHQAFQSKEPFFCFQTGAPLQSDIEEHLRIRLPGPGDPTSGGCIDFQ